MLNLGSVDHWLIDFLLLLLLYMDIIHFRGEMETENPCCGHVIGGKVTWFVSTDETRWWWTSQPDLPTSLVSAWNIFAADWVRFLLRYITRPVISQSVTQGKVLDSIFFSFFFLFFFFFEFRKEINIERLGWAFQSQSWFEIPVSTGNRPSLKLNLKKTNDVV